eukprot:1465267-Alexandrium_andersonii.AAC.1
MKNKQAACSAQAAGAARRGFRRKKVGPSRPVPPMPRSRPTPVARKPTPPPMPHGRRGASKPPKPRRGK